MRNIFFFICFFTFSLQSLGQALEDINYSYLYDPSDPIEFQMKSYRQGNVWKIFYKLTVKDPTRNINHFTILMESRQSVSDKEGKSIQPESLGSSSWDTNGNAMIGFITLIQSPLPPIIVAKIIDMDSKQAWFQFKFLDESYSPPAYLTLSNQIIHLDQYVEGNTPVAISGTASNPLQVTHFSYEFPPASPAFSEAQVAVSKTMDIDSTFQVVTDSFFTPQKPGLYLVQTHAQAKEGLPFRVEPDYPKFQKLENLAEPLIYICTKQEYDKVMQNKGDKKVFDQTILKIIKNRDNAVKFMKNYFDRVALANTYFTTYKEGWKSDRGMIYIVFGKPNVVQFYPDREVWTYKRLNQIKFEFFKSSSIFDPENFILKRDEKYQTDWFLAIEVIRKGGF